MDLNYSYASISFLVGVLSAFQTIAERHRRSRFKATLTRGGLLYLILRGLISAAVFLLLYLTSTQWSSVVHSRPLLWAIVCGTGAEIILRSKIFIREKENPGGGVEEVMRGPLNILLWFQNFFLELIEEQLTPFELRRKIAQANERIELVRQKLPEGGVENMCHRVEINQDAFDDPVIIQSITEAVRDMRNEYETGKDSAYEDKLKYKLAYKLIKIVGEDGFQTLMSEVETSMRPPDDRTGK